MLVHALLEAARRWPDKPAAEDPFRRLTYAQLTTFAKAIRRLVLARTPAPAVGMMLPSSAAALGTVFGTLWAGRTLVPLNFLLQARELAAIVADAGLDLILSTTHFRPLLEQLPVRTLYLEELGLKRRYLWEKLRRTPEPPPAGPDDTAVIIYTSGTTGLPKGVCLTYGNIDWDARAAIPHLQLGPDEHLLGMIPPFHVFGFTVLHVLPVILGGTATYIPRFSPQAAHKALAEGGISIVLAVPSMYAAIARLKSLSPDNFGGIRLAVSGGEPLPRTVYDAVQQRMGLQLLEGYGLTETAPIISVDLPWAHRVGTVGLPLEGIDLQLRDENGQILFPRDQRAAGQRAAGFSPRGLTDRAEPPIAEGELYVRGPLVMKGYYQRPEETAAAIDPAGWFRTGDVVRIDPDGHLSITGRAKDLIIVGGENVFPREVERVLEQHPAVAEAAVIGQLDGSRGEVVVAFITLREGAAATPDELRAFCRERLAGYKTPRQVHILPEFPRGPTGKILKKQLRPVD